MIGYSTHTRLTLAPLFRWAEQEMDLAHVEPSTPAAAAPPAEPPTETPKRGRGRPPKESAAPAAAEPGYTPPKYPPPPSKVLSPDQFFSYWHGIPEAERARFMVYVYRHKPVIRKPKPVYVGKYSIPIPKENLVRIHGAGAYGLDLTDLARSKGAKVCECRIRFDESEYPWENYPPDCDPAELVMDDPDNQPYIRWLKARGLLHMSPQGNDNTNAAALQAMAQTMATTMQKLLDNVVNKKPDADASFTRLMEMFTAGNKAALDMALSQVRANSPEETLKLVTTLQAAFSKPETSLKELVEMVKLFQPQGGTNPQTQMLMDELKELRRQNSDLMTRLLDRGTKEPEESGLMKSAMGRLLERALDTALDGNGGRAPRRSAWAEALEIAGPQIDKGLDTLKVWGTALGAFWGSRAHPPAPPMAPAGIPAGPPPPPPSGAPPQAAPNPAPPQPQAQPQPQTTAEPQEESMRQMLIAFLDRNWPTIQKFINEGTPGQAFADYLMEGGALTVPMLGMIATIGPDKIMDVIRATPEAWQAVQPIEPMFREFLIEFLAWTPGWDEGEEPPPDAPGPRIVPPKGAA